MATSLPTKFGTKLILVSLLSCLALVAVVSLSSHSSIKGDSIGLPRTMLWAWERPEDLRFLNPTSLGVAFLSRTIELRQLTTAKTVEAKPVSARDFWFPDPAANLGVRLKPRLQPLRLEKQTPLMAVVRLETNNDLWQRASPRPLAEAKDSSATTLYTDAQRDVVVTMIAAAARSPQVRALQIDFDASQSEQPFYRALLRDVRAQLPQGMPLSITALASWCTSDSWLDRLPQGTIDEAVPMLFRMGPEELEVASYVKSGREFQAQACRGSVGVSTDEEISQAILSGAIRQRSWSARRIYVFSARSWTRKDAETLTAEVAKWHKE